MTNSESPKVIIVIPARFASVRFPGKPLALSALASNSSSPALAACSRILVRWNPHGLGPHRLASNRYDRWVRGM